MFKPSDNSLISHSSKVMLKILHARFQHYTNQELSDVKLGLERTDETEIILPTFTRSQRKQGNSHTKNLSFVDYTKAFGKLFKRWEYQDILPVSWETCLWVKKQELELCMEKLIGSVLRKEYNRVVCCHPVYLTYMLKASWGMPDWMSYKLESR